jgi:hypothetical protein
MAFNKSQSQGESRNFEAGNKYPGKPEDKSFDKNSDKKSMSESDSEKPGKMSDKGSCGC